MFFSLWTLSKASVEAAVLVDAALVAAGLVDAALVAAALVDAGLVDAALVAAASPPQILAWIAFVRGAIIPASSSCAPSHPLWQGKIHLIVGGIRP
jgi:hypothetical protein